MSKEKGVNKTWGRGRFFVLKNAILRLGLRLGLGSMLERFSYDLEKWFR